MKRFLFGFLAVLFLIVNTIPYLHIMADQSMTDAQVKQVGAFALSSLITSGEATELDFSDYTDSDTDFLLALGELVVTGDPTSLIDCGLDWLGGEIDDAYDSAIQSIREWEYNMSPTLYYWFVDTEPPYDLSPTYNSIRDLAQPLRRLLTPPDDSTPTPSPDPDFSFINNINQAYTNNVIIESATYFSPSSLVRPIENYTIYADFYYNNTNHHSSTNSNLAYARFFYPNLTINLNYDSSNDLYVANYGTFQSVNYENGQAVNNSQTYTITVFQSTKWYRQMYTQSNYNLQYTFEGLSTAINYIYRNFSGINLYVNGELWVQSNYIEPTYPIVIPGQLIIWNDQPLQYEFPSDTYLKLPDLTAIITNAINNSGLVMWSDIADCFVDINGQTAVAVTKIVRNDYDNLYMEQYPYPAMLPGMTNQTKFNEHLLDNSHAYLSPMGTVVQETVNVLPSELVGVLTIGAILTIFAVIINRLLE